MYIKQKDGNLKNNYRFIYFIKSQVDAFYGRVDPVHKQYKI